MATFANVLPELAQRGAGAINEAPRGVLWLSEGWRSYPEQVRLYGNHSSYQQASRRCGSPAAALRQGYLITDRSGRRVVTHQPSPLAAYPGTSDHGKTPATAIDIACAAGYERERDRICRRWGLKQTVAGEGWHRQLDPQRGAMPHAVGLAVEEEDDMPKPDTRVHAVSAPDGGVWTLLYDGGVRATKGAPFYGSYPALPPEHRQGARNFIAIEAVGSKSSDGYRLICDDNEANTYTFTPAVRDWLHSIGRI